MNEEGASFRLLFFTDCETLVFATAAAAAATPSSFIAAAVALWWLSEEGEVADLLERVATPSRAVADGECVGEEEGEGSEPEAGAVVIQAVWPNALPSFFVCRKY